MVSPQKIEIAPFGFYFINLVIGIILDVIILYFHQNNLYPRFFDFALPLYAVNNIFFLGLFFVFYVAEPKRKYHQIGIVTYCVFISLVYVGQNFPELSPVGYLLNYVALIVLILIGIRTVLLAPKKIKNRKSYLLIAYSLLFALVFSLFISVLFKEFKDASQNLFRLVYSFKNLLWFIANLVAAYAIYIFKPAPTSSPLPQSSGAF